MLGLFRRFLRPRPSSAIDPFELLEEQPPRRFWHSNKKGSTVSISVPDLDGEKLVLLFQRPIEVSDVRDGKLVPSAWSEVKRRGGKRQTGLMLSLESAETLYAVLSEALKDAIAKRRSRAFRERVLQIFFSYVAEQNFMATAK